ncbi:MAG: AAA family ATPase [Planctomycetes bacterium]|nr:AAA family ATPase [Planctomycetota bacterium]
MYPFEKIHIRGFRRLANVSLSLRPLNVLIGANGSGKTSLLDCLSLLAASASGNLVEAVSELGGYSALRTNLSDWGCAATEFDLVQNPASENPLTYQLRMEARGVDFSISEESLKQDRGQASPFLHITASRGNVQYYDSVDQRKLVRPNWQINPFESALSQVPKMFSEPEEFRKNLASSTHYHVLDVGPKAPVRLPQPMRTAALPGKDGETIVSCLYMIRETDHDRFEWIQDTLRAGFPSFDRLNFPPVAAGTLAMTWKDRTSSNPFYMHQLSEGTLRFLWLVTLLNSPELPAVTMIDEPEVSLHPELLSVLADLFREASNRTQLVIATHSDRLVRFLTPDEVITANMEQDGTTSFRWGSEFELDQWLKDYTLDQLWGMGRIGGRA